jgi:SnoaL-like domain
VSSTYASHAHVRRPHANPWLVAVVGLAAALVGLGAWVLVDRSTGGGGATQDATALIDDFNAAVNAPDSGAVKALMAKGVVMVSLGDTHVGADAVAKQLTGAASMGLRVERIAPVNVVGQYATTFDKYTSGRETGVMLAVFQVKDGKILRIWGMQPPVMPPFGNEVTG